MTAASRSIVIVGAGQASAALAAALRKRGFDGRITLVGDEPLPPYQRPPLSKTYLLGQKTKEQLYLRPKSFYRENGIELRLGQPVFAIDRQHKRLRLADRTLPYDSLALTTGASARPLPAASGAAVSHVHLVRTVADLDRMAPKMRPGQRLLVVGGGYIGLEAAAVAVKLGVRVTLLEMSDRILQRVAAPETSEYFRSLHAGHGVDIRVGTRLDRLTGDGPVIARLSDGSRAEVDFVVVGIGIIANDTLARDAGLDCDGGILVDLRGRTSDPAIWAAGDCTRFPYKDALIRLESVQNAIDQAEIVAANMLGDERDYVPTPWFWSDQYDIKLQIAGLNTGFDRVVIRPGRADHSASHWYYCGPELVAVDAMNDPRNYMIGKRLIEAGSSPPAESVSSSNCDLKTFLR